MKLFVDKSLFSLQKHGNIVFAKCKNVFLKEKLSHFYIYQLKSDLYSTFYLFVQMMKTNIQKNYSLSQVFEE